jgi:hypothetical protein
LSRLDRWKEPARRRVLRDVKRVMLLLACLVAGCGARSQMGPVGRHAARAGSADATAVTATLTAVFVHPEASQCSTAMTAQYVSQFFSADAARSGTSVGQECRDHQRERAQLAQRYRQVSVHDLLVSGHRARAIVRGANGYPIGVSLVDGPGGWRLDGSGVPIQAPGHGQQVAPQGSLYAYRIPPGFVAAGTAVGPVTTTGAAFSTGVRLPGSPPGDGIAIAQSAANSHVADLAALRKALPRIDGEVRGAPIARAIGPGVAYQVGGRPAVTWALAGIKTAVAPTDGQATFVFSSASNVVVVNCRWPHAGSGRAALRKGCDAVLATLAVG